MGAARAGNRAARARTRAFRDCPAGACQPGELWLAGLNTGAALAVATFVAALTQPGSASAIRDVLWTLTATGVCAVLLCLARYLTLRRT